MSELGIERVGLYNGHRGSTPTRQVCQCCPYGYHIDLGFVEFCDRLVKENSQPTPAKKERRERRRQRQSMEVLLGLTNPVFWNIQQLLPTIPNETNSFEEEAPAPPPRTSSLVGDNSDGLKKAVLDFEATLERTTRKRLGNEVGSTESDAAGQELDVLSHTEPSSSNEASTSFNANAPLKNIREQMAISLERMRDLESEVKTIPQLEIQINNLETEKSILLARITDLTDQLEREQDKSETLSRVIAKPVAKTVREVGILCTSMTREVGVSTMPARVRNMATVTDRPIMVDKETSTDSLQVFDMPANRVSLKDLDKVQEITLTASKQLQTNLDEASVLKVVEKADISVQTDKPGKKLTKSKGTVAKPVMVDAMTVTEPTNVRSRGSSCDKITDVVCDNCQSVKKRTRSIGIGTGNVKETVDPGLELVNNSKSFHSTSQKNTRSIGVSTIPPLKKMTATKQVGTVDVSVPKSHVAVNTDKKNYRDAAVVVDFILKEPCKDCTERETEAGKTENAADKQVLAEDPLPPLKEDSNDEPSSISKKSKIPLPKPTTPLANKKVLSRQDTYTKQLPVTLPAAAPERLKSSEIPQSTEEEKVEVTLRKKTPKPAADAVAEAAHRISFELNLTGNRDSLIAGDRYSGLYDDCGFEYDEHYGDEASNRNSQMFSENAMFQPIQEKLREKLIPSKEMRAAMKVVNDGLHKYPDSLPKHLKTASSIIQQEWFKISSTASANPLDVEDYLDSFEEVSNTLLEFAVNMVDNNGNTAMHYAVSHGNFDVVSILLDSKVCNINKPNAAGYTCVMLVSLAEVRSETHREVVRRLFLLADVNVRAKQHGQTALMLAVSHGRLDMVQLLLDAGADPNIQDCDGSTALMCAAEHGHLEIVKHILGHPDTDSSIVDCDGCSALAIAMEANNRDIGVLLYARDHLAPNSRGSSPYTSVKHRRTRHSSSPHPKTPTSPGLPRRSDSSL